MFNDTQRLDLLMGNIFWKIQKIHKYLSCNNYYINSVFRLLFICYRQRSWIQRKLFSLSLYGKAQANILNKMNVKHLYLKIVI